MISLEKKEGVVGGGRGWLAHSHKLWGPWHLMSSSYAHTQSFLVFEGLGFVTCNILLMATCKRHVRWLVP